MRHPFIACALLAASWLTPIPAQSQEHGNPTSLGEKLGTVAFATSCAARTEESFDQAVALLHSFEFASSRAAFERVLEADPSCAMALWGIALCHWGNPFSAAARPADLLQRGLAAIERAIAIGAKTDRETEYIRAASRLFVGFETTDQRTRMLAFEDAMAGLAARYPGDHEASIFYALALAAAADPFDKTYAKQLKAGAMLERLWTQQPDHPGLAHYILSLIHI